MNEPIIISKDEDMGWIVESYEDGEYEVKNPPLPYQKNEGIDWELAIRLAKERGTKIRYFYYEGEVK